MTIGILGACRLECSKVLHHFEDAAKELSIDVYFYKASDFVIIIINGVMSVVDRAGNEINIDALINWIPYCKFDEISYAFETMGIPVLNDIQTIRNCRNKMLTNILLSECDILQPDTEYYPMLEHNKISTELSYPVVYKNKLGTHGICYKNLYDKNDLNQLIIHESGNNDFYIQNLIENNGWDIRAVVLGDDVLGAMKNSAHGSIEPYTMDSALENICLDIVEELDLHFAEIDIVLGKDNRYYVLEVNAVPKLDIFKDATEVNVAKEIINYTADMLEYT